MAKRKKGKRMSTKKKVLLLLLVALAIGGFWFYKNNNGELSEKLNIKPNKIHIKKLKIVDPDSKTRNIAVMINNHKSARMNHAGLQDAYLTYEIIVEGGLTRMMAIFKDKDTAKIGSVRSSRHYFLDYAMENDAIYTHFGWSPLAQSDISKYGINNINGLTDSSAFWRDRSLNVASEHTAFTSIEKIKSVAKSKGYRMTSDSKLLLNYSVKEVSLSEKEGAMVANKVVIPYSTYITTSYTYDSDNKVYNRFVNGEVHKDAITGKQYTAKNIIIAKMNNSSIDSYGRQDIDNVGTGEGYYITDGSAVPIKWSKSSRESKTKYTYNDGTEIKVNDGNTYIQIQPLSQTTSITE